MKKRNIVIIGVIVLLLIVAGGGYYWYNSYKVPYDNAVSEFNKVTTSRKEDNGDFDKIIASAQTILDDGEKPYQQDTFTELQLSISSAREAKKEIPDMPSNTDEIIDITNNLSAPFDYSEEIADVQQKQQDAENSILQYKQITNPSGDFIVQRLNQIDSIDGVQAVTEDNDPNGNLNKQGGYTAAVYFSSPLVNQDDVFGDSIVEKGTDGGGSVEVYSTIEDAEKRNDYLASFDGGALSSGSHNTLGTIVIRTSDKLTASQQSQLEELIISKLVELQ